ncbi:MAG: 4-hydroxythreonine-4-phosphate dehydrogenase PdxA [Bacteroidaceae bacterium]|nr:4-hydroxythreonine-4-phosphate dehydrogenase PdxA [Bacteroidaceae bacterium]
MNKIKIGITQGDINGVGYEVILKTFENEEMLNLCTPILYGSPKAATYHKKIIGNQTNFVTHESASQCENGALNLINCFGDLELKIDLGQPTTDAGKAALISLERAMKEYDNNLFDVLVTAPIDKHTIQGPSFKFPGHTEYLASKFGNNVSPLMILMTNTLRVALVTTHVPIGKLAETITKGLIEEKLKILDNTLKRDFAIDNPRIAVLSLNPHCGDGGVIGDEEKTIIKPAIQAAFESGIKCVGPYPADGFFGAETYKNYDAVLAMYHDQGLAPFKAIANGEGVNFTAGLPIIRTSPAHGTGYDIAGKNSADAVSFRNAVYMAMDIYRNRKRYDEAHATPLTRQYFEKHDDSDKLKLDLED